MPPTDIIKSAFPFCGEDHQGNFNITMETVQRQVVQRPCFESQLWLAAAYILQGDYTAATSAVQAAEKQVREETPDPLLLERFRLILRYERYDRMPGETNIYIPDVAVQKEKTGGMPRKEVGLLAETGLPALDGFVSFLNVRYQHWLWRSTRNLLRGSRFAPDTSGIAVIYQRQLAVCRDFFQKGDLFAGIYAADFCRSAGATQEAVDWMTQTHQLAEQREDIVAQANCQLWVGDWLSAPYSSPLFWNLALESSSSPNSVLPSAVESIEFSAPSPENIVQARQAFSEAEALFAQVGCERGLGQIHLRFGYLSALAEDFETAAAQTQQAQDLFLKNGDILHARLAETHRLMALVASNKVSEAQALAQQVGTWGQTSGTAAWAASLGILASRWARHLMLRKGMAEGALKGYRIARTLQLAAGNPFHAAQHLTDIGEVYKAIGQTDAAVTYLEQAADEIETVLGGTLKDFQDELNTTLHTLTGIVMLMSDNFLLGMRRMDADLMDRSIGRMQAACRRIEESSSPEERAALPQVGQVLSLYAQMAEQARVLSPLYRSKNLRDRGDFEGFDQTWLQALKALATIAPAQQGVLGAAVWGMKRNWDKAAEAMRQHLAPEGANSGFLGELLQFMERFGEQGKAEIQLQQYRTLTQAVSGLVRTKQFTEALAYFKALGTSFGEQWWTREEAPWLILSDCGEMMEGLGQLEEALSLFDLGMEQLETRRQQLSQDALKVALADAQNTRFLYVYAARAAMAAKQPGRAFRYAEQGKARGLLDLMSENRYWNTGNSDTQAFLLQLRALDAQRTALMGQLAQKHAIAGADDPLLSLLNKKVQDLETQQITLEQALAASHPNVAQQQGAVTKSAFEVTSVAALLQADTLLIEYLVAGDDLLLWAIDADGLVCAEAFKVEDWVLHSDINRLRQAVTLRKPWHAAAEALANQLLNPLAEALQRAEKIIVVAHGPLHLLPFQLLPLADGTPLGLRYPLSYLPSAAALSLLEAVKPLTAARVLAVGNPTGDLEAAAVEALFVARQYGSAAQVLIGAAATEEAVRAQLGTAELLHFATHGHLSEEFPLQSSLALANGDSLTLQELMGMRLRAELVVLSACDTARGVRTGGDDVLGLSRGLIASGAKSAVVSLWPVNDISTALLMGRFYEGLKQGVSPAEALWLAQVYLSGMDRAQQSVALETLEQALPDIGARIWVAASRSKRDISGLDLESSETAEVDYGHPYYWAGFLVVGG